MSDPAIVDLDPSTAGIQPNITNASGIWSVNASGVATFIPALNANGPKSTTYTV